MKKITKRPTIALAVISVMFFVFFLFKSYVNLVEDLSLENSISGVSDFVVDEDDAHEQKLQSLIKSEHPVELDDSKSNLNTQITLGYVDNIYFQNRNNLQLWFGIQMLFIPGNFHVNQKFI